jgi:hypothetical protein
MATTARFGLQSFGGRVPGSFRDNGYAYTLSDRQVIDSLLAALESHTHNGGDRLMDPSPPLLSTLVDTAGHLTGGRTYYYKVSYLDQWGLETAASDEVAMTLPAGPPTPSPPTPTASTGGTLKPGSYYYAIAAYVGDSSQQTLASQAVYVTLTGSMNKITLTFPAADVSADGWVVFRKGPGETQMYCLASVPKASTTYADTGAVISDCTKTPATTDTTATSNKITVTLAIDDIAPVTLEVGALVLSGGSLAAGTYYYRLRPVVTINSITYKGAPTDVTVTAPLSSSKVQFSVLYDGGEFVGTSPPAITVELYGRATTSYKLLSTGSIAGGTTSVVMTDDGSAAGTTVYAGTPTWIAPPPEVAAWRIYRTNTSGNYPSGSLVHHVVETEAADFGGNLVLFWDDMGDPLQAGAPRDSSSTFQPPSSLSLNTQAETCLYTPPTGAPFPGPSVDSALDGLATLLSHQWTKTYTFLEATGPVTGVARFYPGNGFKVLSVRAALSSAMTLSYNVKIDGTTSLWGSPQSVTAMGVTQAAITPTTAYAATSYITVDLVSGTVPAGQALVIHIDLANTG